VWLGTDTRATGTTVFDQDGRGGAYDELGAEGGGGEESGRAVELEDKLRSLHLFGALHVAGARLLPTPGAASAGADAAPSKA
jgi:hypothetical protein